MCDNVSVLENLHLQICFFTFVGFFDGPPFGGGGPGGNDGPGGRGEPPFGVDRWVFFDFRKKNLRQLEMSKHRFVQ